MPSSTAREKILNWLETHQVSASKLADLSGVNRTSFSRFLRCERQLSYDSLTQVLAEIGELEKAPTSSSKENRPEYILASVITKLNPLTKKIVLRQLVSFLNSQPGFSADQSVKKANQLIQSMKTVRGI